MSETFNEREKAFENKFKHDQELEFKATARAARLFGLWAAQKLAMSGADAETYAQHVVEADLEQAGNADVIRKVRHDLRGAGVEFENSLLEKEYERFLAQAREEIFQTA